MLNNDEKVEWKRKISIEMMIPYCGRQKIQKSQGQKLVKMKC